MFPGTVLSATKQWVPHISRVLLREMWETRTFTPSLSTTAMFAEKPHVESRASQISRKGTREIAISCTRLYQ